MGPHTYVTHLYVLLLPAWLAQSLIIFPLLFKCLCLNLIEKLQKGATNLSGVIHRLQEPTENANMNPTRVSSPDLPESFTNFPCTLAVTLSLSGNIWKEKEKTVKPFLEYLLVAGTVRSC